MSKLVIHREIEGDHITDGRLCWCIPMVTEDFSEDCTACDHLLSEHIYNHGAGPAGEIHRYSCSYLPIGGEMCECVFERIEMVIDETEIES